MADTNLVFSKIVAFPKPTIWSQAYNAGKLFATLSLKKDSKEDEESPDSLSIFGKNVLERLEEEFFTIETKNLESIKQAVITTLKEIPDEVTPSFTAVVFIDNILYSFAKGNGKVFIKRGGKFGTILDGTNEDLATATSSSGKLEDNDLIVLATHDFLDIVDPTFLSSSLGNLTPAEIAEALTPKIHEKDDAGAAAFIVKYSKQTTQPIMQEETKQQIEKPQLKAPFFKKMVPVSFAQFSHSKKKFLTVAVVILIVLITSIFFAVKKQNDSKTKALFEEVYASASKKYDEGSSLLDLSKSLAKESLSEAQKIIQDNKDKLPEKSQEKEKAENLLKNINEKLSSISSLEKSTDEKKTLSIAVKNGSGVTGAAAKASDFLKGLGYNVVSTGNADRDDYKNTKIQVKEAKKEFLDILKGDLSKNYTIGETSSDLPENSSEDALIIIGK